MKFKKYLMVCTEEEREKIKLLTSKMKTFSGERVAEVLIRALESLKEGK